MKSSDALLALSALAHGSRLDVFRLLVRRGPEGYTPGEIAQKLDLPAPTLSFHLRELRAGHLVSVERKGRNLHYSADFARMDALLAFLTDHCCSLGNTGCDITTPAVNVRKRA
jgi:ArsR family transcriptional regulator, arsenate/arsenite/antimonite-responsive transcriptional repressor